MNFFDHTLPEVAQDYLANLASLSARLAASQAQVVTGLLQQVEQLEARLVAAEQTLGNLSKTHSADAFVPANFS